MWSDEGVVLKYILWYYVNWMLSFYVFGWCGEVWSIVFLVDGMMVFVVYWVMIWGIDGESWWEVLGMVFVFDLVFGDFV